MTFPILGGNGAVATYSIDNSLRFNDNDSARLTKTFSSGNRKTWTWSAWIKRASSLGSSQSMFGCHTADTDTEQLDLTFNGSNQIQFEGKNTTFKTTSKLFRDVSAWYHIMFVLDMTQSTSDDRMKIYVNGEQETSFATDNTPAQNTDLGINQNSQHAVGMKDRNTAQFFDGYMAEVHFIDGTAKSPTDFGEFDEDSGIWKPIEYTGTYGTNGFYLDFENSGSLGADQSGNGNNFTPTNLASTDQTTDTPTNNFATLNSTLYVNGTSTFSEGNTKLITDATAKLGSASTQGVSSGKWYCEIKAVTASTFLCGVSYNPQESMRNSNHSGFDDWSWGYYGATGEVYNNNSQTSYGSSLSNNDIVMIALDLDNSKLYFGINGTWQNSGVPTSGGAGTGAVSIDSGETYFFEAGDSGSGTTGTFEVNFGNPPFSISSGNSDGNGYGNFEYAPPSGYLALCTQNLATALSPTIDDGSQYFNTKLYSGNSTTNPITGVGFAPDFTWLKARNYANAHFLLDTTRGSGQVLFSSSTSAETDFQGTRWQSFDSDGFTLTGSDSSTNISGGNYVTWNWKANGGTTSSNTDGSITSTVQANTTAGFSVVTYNGTGSAGTVGHGLGKQVDMVILKCRTASQDWRVYSRASMGTSTGDSLYLNLNLAQGSNSNNINSASSTTFGLSSGNLSINATSNTYVAYCFAEIEGYSKFGSFTGNSSSDNVYIHLGFRPAFFMYKVTDTTGNWITTDSARDSYNYADKQIYPNLSNAESSVGSTYSMDLLSSGVKIRNNGVSGSHIYLAIAESPFCTSTGIPVCAR